MGIGLSEGEVLEEFEVEHTQRGFKDFFRRVERHRRGLKRPVEVAMEGYNGWARPLDTQIQQRGYRLLNVNNLKLARYKEIFPAPAKNEQIDARKMLELFQLQRSLPLAKDVLQEVGERPTENLQLKRLTRRRRQLVQEKVRLASRLHSDLQAVCPELASLTGALTNLWFFAVFNLPQGAAPTLANASFLAAENSGYRPTLRSDHPAVASPSWFLFRRLLGGSDDPQRRWTPSRAAGSDR